METARPRPPRPRAAARAKPATEGRATSRERGRFAGESSCGSQIRRNRNAEGRLPQRFARAAAPLLPRGSRVLVACSGGADSVGLLLLLLRVRRLLGLAEIAVAHLDHGLRDGSRADAAAVAALAERLGVPALVARRPVRRRRGESLEDAARRVRYRFLARSAERLGCDVVATAHHMDDQAETVLYRAVRGAGLAGLRGILPATDLAGVRVVRPLLAFRRDEVRRHVERAGEPWTEDPTNAAGNDRARIRGEVLPAIRRALRRDPVPPLARLAAHALRAFADAARPAAAGPGRGRRAPAGEPSRNAPAPAIPRDVSWETVPAGNAPFLERLRARPGTVELLDADALEGDLSVRGPRAGDRFRALGMPAAQRLSHFLQRRGVPASGRAAVRVVCDATGIVCVAGHGIAARVAVRETTGRIVVVRSCGSD